MEPIYLEMFPEFHVSEAEKKAFMRDRNAAIAGPGYGQQVRMENRRRNTLAGNHLPRHNRAGARRRLQG